MGTSCPLFFPCRSLFGTGALARLSGANSKCTIYSQKATLIKETNAARPVEAYKAQLRIAFAEPVRSH